MSEPRSIADLIKNLEAEYDLDRGFLGRLRQGDFDAKGLERMIHVLASIELGEEAAIDRRLVALLWLIPTIMSWQIPRVSERGGDVAQLQHGIDKVQEVLNTLLGTP